MKIGIMMFQVVLFGLAICPALGAPQLRPTFNELARLDGKIVGGEATTIEAYPHQASVQLLGGHWCGGAIISASYVLSAAHCFEYPVNWYDTRVGTTFHSTGGIETAIDTLTIHPNYNVLNLDNDLAILLLVTPLPLGNAISPIQMAFDNQQIAPGTNTVVSGWGALFQGGPSPAQLQAVSVPVVGNSDCAIAYAGYLVSDSMLCAGFPEGGRDACQGDSGGPLIANGVLVGLVSWGLGCAQPNYPGVYVSVPSVRAYIRQVTGV